MKKVFKKFAGMNNCCTFATANKGKASCEFIEKEISENSSVGRAQPCQG